MGECTSYVRVVDITQWLFCGWNGGKHSGSIGRNLLATVVSVYLLHIFARKSMLTGEKREKEILHVIQNQLLLACCT